MKIYDACGNSFIVGETMIDLALCQQYEVDGFILVLEDAVRFFNKDGSEAGLCVNGLRCYMQYCYEHIAPMLEREVTCKTQKAHIEIIKVDPFTCKVSLELPTLKQNHCFMGNKHVIELNHQVNEAAYLCQKYQSNIHYTSIVNRNKIRVLSFEVGVGFTRSCGSGSLASSYYCFMHDLCDSLVEVQCIGGTLICEFDTMMHLTGESKYIKTLEDE